MNAKSLKELLEQSLEQFSLAHHADTLVNYLQLLEKWNATYNLTAIRSLPDMVTKHIVDSLAIRCWLKGTTVIDVGTGAGLPGIPLAITCPDQHFVLLDSNGKKTRFLQEVQRRLAIKNIEIVHFRVEDFRPTQGFDTVISRAFSNLAQFIHWTKHLVATDGIWLAMKGVHPEDELKEINYSYQVKHYQLAEIEGERCCVIINQNDV